MRSKIIQIFVQDTDDSSSVRIAKLSNSIAQIYVVPRAKLDYIKEQADLSHPALYMLFDDERSMVYIGECENFTNRVKDHVVNKAFWQTAVICIASNQTGLNKADVKYLESYSIDKAVEAGRFSVQNSNVPVAPMLDSFELVAMTDYLADAELLLTSLGYNVFEPLTAESKATDTPTESVHANRDQRDYDTIVSPCSGDGFQQAFVNKSAWWAVRIGQPAMKKLKYVALYESAPISAIRAYAKITTIEAMPNEPGRYMIHHDGGIQYLEHPVQLGQNSNLSLQGSRYYLLNDILASKTIGELTNRAFGTQFTG